MTSEFDLAFEIYLTPSNTPPTITLGANQSVNEDAAAQTVPGFATGISAVEPDQTITSVTVTNDNNGLFSAQPAIDQGTGTLTYTPAPNANGSATVTVTVQDDGGTAAGGQDTTTSTFTITVNSVNDAPAFTKGADQTVDEDAGARTVTTWATAISAGPANESGQTLTFNVTNNHNSLFAVQPAVAANGTLTYTPAPNANGTATVTVTLSDSGDTANGGVNASASQTFNITVNAVNDAPVFSGLSGLQTATEDTDKVLSGLTLTDVDAGSSSLTVTLSATNGQVTPSTVTGTLAEVNAALSSITYRANADYNGPDTITMIASDGGATGSGGAQSATLSLPINVTPVNDAPSFTKGADQTVDEDAVPQSIPNWATAISKGPADESGQTLTFAVTNNNNGLFSAQPAIDSNGTLTYTLAPNANGTATVTVTLTDNGGGTNTSAPQTFTITVNGVNDVPSFTKGADEVINEDAGPRAVTGWASGISAGAANESGQGLTFVVTDNTNPGLFSLAPSINSAGDLTYTPAADASGMATVTIVLQDNGGTANNGVDTSAAETFTITVNPVNDAPTITLGANQSVAEDSGAQSVPNFATGISAVEAGQNITSLTITSDNPTLFSDPPSIHPGTGELTYTPALDANGTATVTVTLEDDGGTANGGQDTTTRTFSIEVRPVNDVPSFTAGDSQAVGEDAGPQTVNNWATSISKGPANESGQTLTFVVTGNTNPALFAAGPAIDPVTGHLTYTPADNANGTADITVELRDNGGTTDSGVDTSAGETFTISVTAMNDAPVLSGVPGARTVLEDTDLTIVGISVADVDASVLAVDLVANGRLTLTTTAGLTFHSGANGDKSMTFSGSPASLNAALASLTYRADADSTTPDTLNVAVTDMGNTGVGGAQTASAATAITITPVNDAPTFTMGANPTVDEDAGPQSVAWATNLSPGPADESGQTLTFAVTSNTNPALFSAQPAIDSTGTLTYTPAPNANGTATVTVQLNDSGDTSNGGQNATAPQTFIITVREVNDEPVAVNDSIGGGVPEDGGPAFFPVALLLGNDSNGPNEGGQTLTMISVGNETGGTAGIDGTTVIFTLAPNFYGTASFDYVARDDGTTNGAPDPKDSNPATVYFTVNPVAEPPAITPTTTSEDTQSDEGLVISPDAADGGGVTHFLITGITGGSLYKSDGSSQISNGEYITLTEGGDGLKFTPAADLNSPAGAFSFTVQAALDAVGTGISSGKSVTITVTEVNDAPTGVNDTLTSVAEDSGARTILAADLLANDDKGATNESGQTLSITAVDTAQHGTVSLVGGNVVFTPDANYFGPASFRYTLEDNGTTNGSADVKSSTAIASFMVTGMPDAPEITGAATAEDTQTASGLVVTPNTLDGAEVTHFQITSITNGTLYQNDGTTVITNGTYITKAEGAAGLKFAPSQNLNTPAGDTIGFTVSAAMDTAGTGLSLGTPVAITVSEVNDAPTGVNDILADTVENSGPWTIPFTDLTANDVVGPNENGQTLTVTAVSNPVGGTVAISGSNVIFTADPHYNGPASFTYTLQDNGTTAGVADPLTSTAVASFTVTEVNDAPAGADDTLAAVAEDSGARTIPFATLLGNDSKGPANESGQTLTITAVSNPTGGTVAISGTDVIFTPELNFNGTARFTYTIQDTGTTTGVADPKTGTADVSFTVTPVNDAPVAQDKALSMTLGESATGSVTATDVDGDPSTYSVVTPPTKGTVTMTTAGTFTYQAQTVGTDTFTYKANDGALDSNVATVTITISSQPIVPILTITVPVTETRESSIVASGTANPFSTVVVNGSSVQADAHGNWSAAVALAEGPNTITASNGALTRSVTVVRDTVPPVITLTASAARTDEETVTLRAVSEDGARIQIQGFEAATLTVPLKMGMNRFSATATDRVGNQSTATVSVLRVGKVPKPVVKEIPTGESGEAFTQYFRVRLPGEAAHEPLLLQIISPSTNSAAIRQAESVAAVAGTGEAEVTGQDDNTPIHTFSAPATVMFTYDPAKVSNPADLRIYYFDPQWKVWVELGGVVDPKNHTITVQVEHFTTFAAMEPRADAPVLDAPPSVVRTEQLTVTGTSKPDTPVSLVINGEVQSTARTDAGGSFTLNGKLTAGRNWVYVKGTGTLASREMTVAYRPVNYTDIGDHWAEQAILRLAKLEVVSLYPEPLFGPEERVTRLEFAVMVARVLGLTPVDAAPAFTDTDAMPDWALPEVAAAVKAGIIKGMPDGSFAPNALVTRAEMAVMLTRALNYAGKDTAPGDKDFADGDQIPGWAKDQVLTAARYGLITGYPDGTFQSGNSTTRAEAVTMLNRLLGALSSQ